MEMLRYQGFQRLDGEGLQFQRDSAAFGALSLATGSF